MRKINYVRPLAEVIDLEIMDIITTSVFDDSLDKDKKGIAIAEGNLDKYVNDGKIVLQ